MFWQNFQIPCFPWRGIFLVPFSLFSLCRRYPVSYKSSRIQAHPHNLLQIVPNTLTFSVFVRCRAGSICGSCCKWERFSVSTCRCRFEAEAWPKASRGWRCWPTKQARPTGGSGQTWRPEHRCRRSWGGTTVWGFGTAATRGEAEGGWWGCWRMDYINMLNILYEQSILFGGKSVF